MLLSLASLFLLASILRSSSTAHIDDDHATNILHTYMVECVAGKGLQFLDNIVQHHASIATRINFSFYCAASVVFDPRTTSSLVEADVVDALKNSLQVERVTNLDPFDADLGYDEDGEDGEDEEKREDDDEDDEKDSAIFNSTLFHGRQRRNESPQPFPPHVMTQVDLLHRRNITGKGIKIAIIHSGIDYNHPALGNGCLGRGCLIEDYHNFAPDWCATTFDDVMDCHGGGTLIAGSIAAQPNTNPLGLVGASPDARLNIYRVTSYSSHAVIMSAFARAIAHESAIILIPVGFIALRSTAVQSPLSRFVTAAIDRGIAVITDQGRHDRYGAFALKSWAGAPNAITVAAFRSTHISTIATRTYYDPDGSSSGTTRGTQVAVSVSYVPREDDGGSDSIIHRSSSWGPSMDLSVKPQFAAPGWNIVSTYPLNMRGSKGGYAVRGGNYLASALVAGIYALLGELHDGRVLPAEFERLLSITALPQESRLDNLLAPVPQQGAGLVQAYDAARTAHACSTWTDVSPASLSFNDTDSAPEFLTIEITNRARSRTLTTELEPAAAVAATTDSITAGNITYTLRHIPARTFYTLSRVGVPNFRSTNVYVSAAATLRFEPVSSLTLTEGTTVTIKVRAEAPLPLVLFEKQRLPVFSGWVAVEGSDGSRFRVPYQGMVGQLRTAAVLGRRRAFLVDEERRPYTATEPKRRDFSLSRCADATNKGDAKAAAVECPWLGADFSMPTPQVDIFVVPVPPDTTYSHAVNFGLLLTEEAPVLLEVASSPLPWRWRGPQVLMRWDGRLKMNGTESDDGEDEDSGGNRTSKEADRIREMNRERSRVRERNRERSGRPPPGTYLFAVRALRPSGDPSNPAHWDVATTSTFKLVA